MKITSLLYKLPKYLTHVSEVINNISKEESISRAYLYWDSLYCLLRHGCLINQYYRGHFYKLGAALRNQAFTQRRVEAVIHKYNTEEGIRILQNKREFNSYFSEYVSRKWVYAKEMSFESFMEVYESSDKIFIKPIDSQEGEGIKAISTHERSALDLFQELNGTRQLVEEGLSQHQRLKFGNASVNTARILTVLDKSGKAHIIRAGLRVGVGDAVVDNYTAGGVLYEIDIETGVIDHKGIQGTNYDVIYHPGTSTCMLGYQLPNWKQAIDSVLRSAEKLPSCRFIGWDVAFTDSNGGGVELIEGNHNPGIFTLESLGTPGAYRDTIRILEQS